jgi:hypothetical protein
MVITQKSKKEARTLIVRQLCVGFGIKGVCAAHRDVSPTAFMENVCRGLRQ